MEPLLSIFGQPYVLSLVLSLCLRPFRFGPGTGTESQACITLGIRQLRQADCRFVAVASPVFGSVQDNLIPSGVGPVAFDRAVRVGLHKDVCIEFRVLR